MGLHKQPATQTDQNTTNVRYDQNRDHPLVAMPSVSQQDPSNNPIKPRRRERVADPARDLVRRQRAVEAARPGHLFLSLVALRRRPAALIKHSGCTPNDAAAWLRREQLALWRRIIEYFCRHQDVLADL